MNQPTSQTSALPLEMRNSPIADRYLVEREIGHGGMGTVYLAEDRKHKRPVAIKVLHPRLAAAIGAARFLREIEITARLQHPHILPLYDSGEASGVLYYVMPFVEGESLRDRLRRDRQLALEEAVRIARQVGDALAYAHTRGVVHRDIKPDNVLLAGGHAIVADFGIARAITEAGGPMLTEPGFVVGTPAYMSPEQGSGDSAQLDGRSDIYSLGCVVYEMLVGEPPFSGSSPQAILARHQSDEVPSIRTVRPAVPEEVERAVRRSLAKMAADRFATATQFSDALAAGAALREPTDGGAPATTTPRTRAGKQMLAILPFRNMSADAEQEYFSDGMTEEMIAQLGRMNPRRLGVIARTSSMRYKGVEKSVEEIGRELRVDYLLEGSVRRAGGRVRITAQLIQVSDQTHLWAGTYDRETADVFELQSDVAGRIASSLALELLPSRDTPAAQPPTRDAATYDFYLKGRYFFSKGTDEARREAVGQFELAIAADPEYALAHAALANCYLSLAADSALPPREGYERARAAAQRALELDESLGAAHAHLALIHMAFDWDWSAAERGFERAVELDLNSAQTRGLYSTYLAATGRVEEALAEARRALELDPLSPGRSLTVATRLHFVRRYDAAIEQLRRTLALAPGYSVAHYYLGKALVEKGQLEEGIQELERAFQDSSSPSDLAELGRARALAGQREVASEILSRLAAWEDGYVSPCDLAKVCEGLGRTEEALAHLERACEERSAEIVFLKVEPEWDRLRPDPRFRSLLKRLNLSAD